MPASDTAGPEIWRHSIGERVAFRIERAAAVESDLPAGNADLIRSGIGDRRIVARADRAGHHFISNSRNIGGNSMLDAVVAFQVILRTHEVAELESGDDAACLVAADQRFVHAAFESESKAVG